MRVSDVDTVHLAITLPPPYGPSRFHCRIAGVRCPDLRSKCEKERALARELRSILQELVQYQEVSATANGYDKYGRILVRVSTSNCSDVSSYLVDRKVAVGSESDRVDWALVFQQFVRAKHAEAHAE